MKDLIVIKIGGSLITDKFSDTPKINQENLKRISEEISSVYNKEKMSLIIVHGVGSYGHVIVKKTGIDKGIRTEKQLVDFAETKRLQNELNSIVSKYLIDAGLPAIPFQASSFTVLDQGRIVRMDLSAIKSFLEIDMIPVLYGVPAYDRTYKCSILSGDQITPYLAVNLNAKKIIHATNVDGVFTADPNKNAGAKLIPEINSENIEQVKDWLDGSTATDVTGGMLGKISELLEIDVESQIINALIKGNIAKAFRNEKIGTVIRLRI
jgi:isopentenyl phosphate kinase